MIDKGSGGDGTSHPVYQYTYPMHHDLLIRRGTCVLPWGEAQTDIGVTAGRITTCTPRPPIRPRPYSTPTTSTSCPG